MENSIKNFDGKVSECSLRGMIDLTHKIESDIEILDTKLSGFVKLETTSIDQVRNIRLEDNLNELKQRLYMYKEQIISRG